MTLKSQRLVKNSNNTAGVITIWQRMVRWSFHLNSTQLMLLPAIAFTFSSHSHCETHWHLMNGNMAKLKMSWHYCTTTTFREHVVLLKPAEEKHLFFKWFPEKNNFFLLFRRIQISAHKFCRWEHLFQSTFEYSKFIH